MPSVVCLITNRWIASTATTEDDETKSDMPVIESKKENGITGGKVHVCIVRYRNYQFALQRLADQTLWKFMKI